MCGNVFFQAEDGIRDLVRSRGLGDVYKRQELRGERVTMSGKSDKAPALILDFGLWILDGQVRACLLYTSDAADERSSVDLGGRRIIKKKNSCDIVGGHVHRHTKRQIR